MHMCFCLLRRIQRKQLQNHERLETIYGNDAVVSASSNCVEEIQTCKDLEDDLQNMGYSVQVLEKLFKQVLGLKL
jgi:methylphosphotriester-DNA--protein-cysteine methyltransferase